MESWPEGYFEKIEKVIGQNFESGKIDLKYTVNNEDEAKLTIKKIKLLQKQLRQIKKEAIDDIKIIKSFYRGEINSVEAGLVNSLFGFGGSERENQRRILRNKRDREVKKYDNVKTTIDKFTLSMDNLILEIEELILSGEY